MKNLILLLTLILISTENSFSQNHVTDSANKTKITKDLEGNTKPITFLLYGELLPKNYIDPYIDKNVDKITKKFGFIVKRVTGCVISRETIHIVKKQNKESNEKMKLKYGVNWKKNFEKQTNKKLSI